MPPSRNDLIFDMRRRDDAEGDSRMMGSDLLLLTFDTAGFCACGIGLVASVFADWEGPGLAPGAPLSDRLPRKVSPCLRTCEKSYQSQSSITQNLSIPTVGLIPRNMELWSPILRSPL